MISWQTHSAKVQNNLTNAGYFIQKNVKQGCWEMKDNGKVIMSSKALGDLLNKASKEFGI